jgi:hypothetical protein
MATAKKSRYVGKHRAEELPVRRWLQLSAASAGVGAALLGWSLVGPQVDVAAADSANQPSAPGPASSPGQGAAGSQSGPSATAGSRSTGSSAPSSTPGKASRTPTTETGNDEPTDTTHRSPSSTLTAQRTATSSSPGAAQPSTVADRFAAATSVTTRMASRAPAVAAAVPSGNPVATVQSALGRSTAAAQPNLTPSAKVTFQFEYTDGAEYWTPELRRGLQTAANTLAATYFVVDRPVTLTYTVKGEDDPDKLAAAGSNGFSRNPGFDNVVVQEKLLTGLDLNGLQPDGDIDWSFAAPWSAQPKPSPDEYDLTSTAMHELLHSFGFLSYIESPKQAVTNDDWAIYDSFIVDQNGTRAVGSDGRFNSALTGNLVGLGGLYLNGPNAVAAYGKPVPLFTPYPFQPGSSISHLDDYTFTRANGNFQMMTSADGMGPGPKTLTGIEQGVLADIGYNIRFQAPAPYSPVYGFTFVGFLFLRRKKRQTPDED